MNFRGLLLASLVIGTASADNQVSAGLDSYKDAGYQTNLELGKFKKLAPALAWHMMIGYFAGVAQGSYTLQDCLEEVRLSEEVLREVFRHANIQYKGKSEAQLLQQARSTRNFSEIYTPVGRWVFYSGFSNWILRKIVDKEYVPTMSLRTAAYATGYGNAVK